MHFAEHLVFIILIIVLIFASITDLRERLIYDRFVLVGLGAVLAVRFFGKNAWWGYFSPAWVSPLPWPPLRW